MSNYLEQEYDFIKRTKSILKQYEENIKGTNKYEVTLLLNCFVGLIILPQQLWFDNLPNDLISEKEWGVSPNHISCINSTEKNIKNITRHLRNSIAHYQFVVFSNKKEKISSIKFLDKNGDNEKTFEAIIPIPNLRKFLNIFSDHILEKMQKSKI